METVEKVLPLLRWAYALAVCTTHKPDEIIAVKRGSPLIFARNKETQEFFISSDTQALSGYAKELTQLEDGDLVYIKWDKFIVKSEGKIVRKSMESLDTEAMEASKWDFPTFMLKEIFEQPAVIKRGFKWRINFDTGDIYSNSVEYIKNMDIRKIVFVGCWTSYNSGQLGALWIEELTGINCKSEIASEYMYKNIETDCHTLHVFLSQSGETADSIEVLKHIKDKWGVTLGIVNVVGSTIARITDCGFFLKAGYEIGVASTKAFTAQLMCILFLALYLGKKNHLSYGHFRKILSGLNKIPTLMQNILDQKSEIQKIAKEVCTFKNIFYLWRNLQLPVADEGSLKLKEISYLHTESYPAWELKHGPLALIEESFLSILICPEDLVFEQNMSSLAEFEKFWLSQTKR